MKADFAQILMSNKVKTESASSLVDNNANGTTINILREGERVSTMAKSFIITALVLIVVGAVLTTAFIVRYEDKLEAQQARIEHLESKLDNLLISLMPEMELGDVEGDDVPDDDDEFVEYETKVEHLDQDGEDEQFYSESDEIELEQGQTTTTLTTPKTMTEFKDPEEMEMTLVRVGREGEEADEKEFGKVNSKPRSKRQVPFPNVPTFGPHVPRTAEGVPIVEESYLSSVGVTLRPRLLTAPTTDDANRFTLYGSLDRTGSNLDWGHTHTNTGVLPHHQVSAAWDGDDGQGQGQRLSQAKEQHHGRRRVQVKSGDGGGETELAGTGYSRGSNSGGSSNSNYRRQQQRVTPSSTASLSGSFSSGTYHRNSRVPATPEYFYPTTKSASELQSQHQFGPLRKLGNGEGEVIARVVQPNDAENEADSDTYANAAYGQSGTAESSSTRRKVYGRRGQGQGNGHGQPQGQGGIVSSAQTQSYRRRGQGQVRRTNVNPVGVPYQKNYGQAGHGQRHGQVQSMESFLSQSYYGNVPVRGDDASAA